MKKSMIFLFIMSSLLFSQNKEYKHALGFSGGMISGTGFTYRQMGEKWGFQIAFGIISYKDQDHYFDEPYTSTYDKSWIPNTDEIFKVSSSDRSTWGNIGFTIYKPLHRANRSLFYVLGAVSDYYSHEKEAYKNYKYVLEPGTETTYSYVPISDIEYETTTEHSIHFGIGLGVEYQLTQNIRISFEWPLSIVADGGIYMYVPQGGIFYYFK